MGRAILEAATRSEAARVAGVVGRRAERPEGLHSSMAYTNDLRAALKAEEEGVVVDVSGAEGAAGRIEQVASAGRPLVEGTTGLDAPALDALAAAAARIAVVEAPNLSPGVALLGRALRAILAARGPAWDAAILDRHHRAKRDAPSGTARLLARILAEGGAGRPAVASFRQGGVMGEHAVHLSGDDEELVLVHRALSRRAFAEGALLAAAFARTAPPGRYGMDEVLGFAG
jgi:4-hydroxy-tetrahydrodipicolinate reductase